MIKKGNLLISEPTVFSDQNFNRSVILLVDHSNSGSVGFVLNKKSEYLSKELIPQLEYEFPIYNGGPVQQENLYFIHNKPNLISNSLKITNEMYWGGDFNSVINLISEKKIKTNEIKFFLGYSGWDSGQLENEINSSYWIVKNKDVNFQLILKNCNNIWKDNLIKLGGDYLIWSNSPENPNHN